MMFWRLNLLVNGQEFPVINLVQELGILFFLRDFPDNLVASAYSSLSIDCLLIVQHSGGNVHMQCRSLWPGGEFPRKQEGHLRGENRPSGRLAKAQTGGTDRHLTGM